MVCLVCSYECSSQRHIIFIALSLLLSDSFSHVRSPVDMCQNVVSCVTAAASRLQENTFIIVLWLLGLPVCIRCMHYVSLLADELHLCLMYANNDYENTRVCYVMYYCTCEHMSLVAGESLTDICTEHRHTSTFGSHFSSALFIRANVTPWF